MSSDERMGRYTWSERMYVLEAKEMCKRVERICQVDPEGWYAPVIGEELVRCKDCKYAYKGIKSYTCQRVFKPFTIEEDGFCSWAERKEEWTE
jgi:hypothetical protein